MNRIWLIFGLGSGLAFAVIVVFYYFTDKILVAALLGAWPALAIALYDRFVNVPLITFERQTIQKDSFRVIDREGVVWNFLRLTVKNRGLAPARNCRAELRVLEWPQRNGQSCPLPSGEPKGLNWAGFEHKNKGIFKANWITGFALTMPFTY